MANRLAPATAKGRATRERIVQAAAKLVAEKGAAGMSLDDVRARTGASRSQLYHYFEDRDDLAHAAIHASSGLRSTQPATTSASPLPDHWPLCAAEAAGRCRTCARAAPAHAGVRPPIAYAHFPGLDFALRAGAGVRPLAPKSNGGSVL